MGKRINKIRDFGVLTIRECYTILLDALFGVISYPPESYAFEDNNDYAETVNGASYRTMLENYLL